MTLPFFGVLLPNAFAVRLDNQTISGSAVGPADAEAGFRIATDGRIYQRTTLGGAYALINTLEWLDPHSASEADDYECFATLDSGFLTTGTTGSWLDLSSNQDWTKVKSGVGSLSVTITIQIRKKGTTDVLDSGTITLTAEVT